MFKEIQISLDIIIKSTQRGKNIAFCPHQALRKTIQ